jgi:N-acetylglutamate synthase-like GNAT family acetyltransferase
MSLSVNFQLARASDAEAIAELVESAYRGELSKQGWTTEADLLDGQRTDAKAVLELIGAARSEIWLAYNETILLACAHIEMQSDGCHFGMFAVRPTLQASGVGKALLAHCEASAKANFAAEQMLLSVIWTRESLMQFYQRRGYQLNGEKLPFPYGDERFGKPKRDDLYFLVMDKPLA